MRASYRCLPEPTSARGIFRLSATTLTPPFYSSESRITRTATRSAAAPSAGPIDDVLPEDRIAFPLHERRRRPVRTAVGGEGHTPPLAVVPADQQGVTAHSRRHRGL